MAERRPPLQVVLIGGAIALLVGGWLLFRSAPGPEEIASGGEGTPVREVATLRVRAAEVRSQVEVSAILEARRSVTLFAETRGPVIEVGAEELDEVEAGRLLARIDPLRAEVAVERAEAAVMRARSQLALASSHLVRRRSLADRGVASESDLEDAENAEKVAAAALREARAELTRARDDLEKKTIAAPLSGVLRRFSVEVGEYVSEGQQLAELLDLQTARATIGLSDREVVAVRVGQPVRVRVEAYPGERFDGVVLRVGAASDPVNKKFPVEIELPNPTRRLLPGMVARVSLDLGASAPRTLVPRDATVDEFGLRFVYVIGASHGGEGLVARRRRVAVRPLPFHPEHFEVVSGLSEGEEIALTEIRQLHDGERVVRDGNRSR